MKDTKEIVLFFKENTTFVALDVANEIVKRFPFIGNPIILPENDGGPIIVFKEYDDLQIQCNNASVNLLVNHKYFDNLSSFIFDLVDLFEEFKCEFKRIGYISNIFLSPTKIKKCIDTYFVKDNLPELTDFNFSFYKKIEDKIGVINCWERYVTDQNGFKDLLVQFDFNSVSDEVINLDMKYIKEFLSIASDYIDERIIL